MKKRVVLTGIKELKYDMYRIATSPYVSERNTRIIWMNEKYQFYSGYLYALVRSGDISLSQYTALHEMMHSITADIKNNIK